MMHVSKSNSIVTLIPFHISYEEIMIEFVFFLLWEKERDLTQPYDESQNTNTEFNNQLTTQNATETAIQLV